MGLTYSMDDLYTWNAHCKDRFPREFAYKPLPGESPRNLNIIRTRRVYNINALAAQIKAYSTRPGLFASVYSFEPGGGYSTAILDRIYLDFDCSEDLERAIEEAGAAAEALRELSIEPHMYFSGMKGIACYIEFSPVDIAPENKKEVLAMLWDIIEKGLDIEILTLDKGSVKGDIARISRLPNTRHESGYYCIPLTDSDVRAGTHHILALAKQPRYDIDLDNTIRDSARANDKSIPHMLRILERHVIAERASVQEMRTSEPAETAKEKEKEPVKKGYVTIHEIEMAKQYPISDIIGTGTKDKLVLCPFHDDSVPSLSINHEKNLWFCHGCKRSGNVIQLVMDIEKMSFQDTVLMLANSQRRQE